MNYTQQGDCLLFGTDKIPAAAKHLKGEKVLHFGATGNHHKLTGTAFGIFQDGDTKYVDVAETAMLGHEEHKNITLDPGKYVLKFVREKDHFNDLVRAVVD